MKPPRDPHVCPDVCPCPQCRKDRFRGWCRGLLARPICALFGHDPAMAHQQYMGEQAFAQWHDDLRKKFVWPPGINGCCHCGEAPRRNEWPISIRP